MKKILALILILAAVLSLVACGSGGDKAETSADTKIEDTAESNEGEKTPENEKTEDKVKDEKTENKKEEADSKKPAEAKPADKPQTVKPEEKPDQKPAETPAQKPEEKPQESAPKTAGNILLDDFKAKAGSHSSALSLAEAISQNSIIPFAPVAMTVEEGYLAGFDSEIKGFKEGATFAPMIGSIPFVGYVFILEDGADVSAFISVLKQNANLRWNICVEAEETVTGSVGNKVFFVMSNKSFEE